MEIVNSGVLGIVFNFAPNSGVQAGLIVNGASAGASFAAYGATGTVFNYSSNFGTQAGVYLK